MVVEEVFHFIDEEEDEEEEVDPEEAKFIKKTFETFEAIMKRLDSIEELLGIHE